MPNSKFFATRSAFKGGRQASPHFATTSMTWFPSIDKATLAWSIPDLFDEEQMPLRNTRHLFVPRRRRRDKCPLPSLMLAYRQSDRRTEAKEHLMRVPSPCAGRPANFYISRHCGDPDHHGRARPDLASKEKLPEPIRKQDRLRADRPLGTPLGRLVSAVVCRIGFSFDIHQK